MANAHKRFMQIAMEEALLCAKCVGLAWRSAGRLRTANAATGHPPAHSLTSSTKSSRRT